MPVPGPAPGSDPFGSGLAFGRGARSKGSDPGCTRLPDPGCTSLPSEARYLAAACAAFGLGFRDVSGEGYLLEISDGARTLALAAGRACIYPTNSAAAFTLAKDKMHTSRLLEAHGLATLGGALFFVSDHHRQYRAPGREREDAIRHGVAHGFPLFAKPNMGARGDLAEIVHDRERLETYLEEAATRYDAVILQDVFSGPEYRVLCLDGEVMFCVERATATLRGDGRSALGELIAAYNTSLAGSGISGIPEQSIPVIAAQAGLAPGEMVATGRIVNLPGRRNLAASGRSERLVEPVPAQLASLALAAARLTGLNVAGVDLMDISGGSDFSLLRVIEVNGAPGITALEQLGRMDLILEIWRRILSRAFGRELKPLP